MPQAKDVTWIVIADGERAHILLSPAHGQPLRRLAEGDLEGSLAHRDDPAFRREVHETRPEGHTTGPTEWKRVEKERFHKDIAERIDKAAARGAFARLVLVAPPKTLGDLRAELSDRTRRMVAAEIDRDLTKHSDEEVRDHVAALIPI